MEFDRTGIILYTLAYEACVAFYAKVLGLKIMFTAQDLTCFEFGSSYIMVERDDTDTGTPLESERIKTCLRMNVPDVRQLAELLRAQGVEVDYQEHAWGTVAKFYDPDGNLCAFKDSPKFEKQITDHQPD